MEIGIYTKYVNQGGTIKSLTTYHNPGWETEGGSWSLWL